jgi:dGTPase
VGYTEHDTQRWIDEGDKRPGRTEFQRDRARVLHSAALRRLAGKTQVVPVTYGDFPRTRLTHSLECAQIGRDLGAALGCDPDLTDAACLAHDIGHPPFGHNGETALAELGPFEGNAQSLRLLTRLEPKVPGAGLNLTRATLDATLKYPWIGTHGKYGAYPEDAAVFGWIRGDAPDGRRCLEAQVMDWADDVAYSVHDVEDGLYNGLISIKAFNSERRRVTATALTYCKPEWAATEAELEEVLTDFLALEIWRFDFDGGLAGLSAAKNLTSELVGRFCQVTRDGADLVVPRRHLLECALLKALAWEFVMIRDGAARSQARERELIAELAAAIESGAPATLDPLLRPSWEAATADAAKRRVVIDQIACLTDTSAIAWHRRLVA